MKAKNSTLTLKYLPNQIFNYKNYETFCINQKSKVRSQKSRVKSQELACNVFKIEIKNIYVSGLFKDSNKSFPN